MKKGLFAKSKTFKPRKQHAKGTKRYELHKKAKVTLGSGDLRQAVQLPAGEELNEWLAVNTVVSTLHQHPHKSNSRLPNNHRTFSTK